ncbi:MAG: chitobiase/beta-hexosaminidase C-terminal domain-containing protein, partial [Paenibacillaceae bacterium]|nr:chitobiase/beta-hexosaminidase C-terminal domain-containing protein [Paenibacillaceae bacterium]
GEFGDLYVPVGDVAEAYGKYLFQDDARRVWVISDQPAIFDPGTEGALLDALADARYGVRKPAFTIAGTAPAPDDVSEQAASYAARNDAAELEKLAKRLNEALVDDVPELATFRMLVANGQYEQALVEFRSYFMNKLRSLPALNWSSSLFSGALASIGNNAEELLYEVISTDSGKTKIGEPGEINWHYGELEQPFDYLTVNYLVYMWHPLQFVPLIDRFLKTNNLSYLDKWAEYIDDWAQHADGFDSLLPPNVSDKDSNGAGIVNMHVRLLRSIAQKLPEDGEGMPPATLARVMLKLVEDYPPTTITYAKSNPQNWTTGEFTSLIANGLLLSEFKDTAVYLREGMRKMEDYATTMMMPDGAEAEQSISYNREYLRFGAGAALPGILAVQPELIEGDKQAELEEHMWSRARLMAGALTPDGKYPAGYRIDLRDWTATVQDLLQNGLPEALNDPNIAAIVAIARGTAGDQVPTFESEWYPYGGYSFIRDGWERTDQRAFMFSSSHTGNYSFHNEANNMLTIAAYGQDMIVPGEVGAYDHIKSPLLVDGMLQNSSYGIPTWGHRQTLVSAWDEPADLRWHESDAFVLTEGQYNGHYGGDSGTDDVGHGRVLQFARDAGLWIVTDRLTTDASHEYTLDWRLPSKDVSPRSGSYKAFDDVQVDDDGRTAELRTNDSGIANLSIYQFGTSPLEATGAVENVDDTNLYNVSDFYRFGTTFGGDGDQALVSLIVPRETVGTDIETIEERNGDGIAGFKATLADGRTVLYQAAADGNRPLSLDGVSVQGESLLLIKETDGSAKGMALGVVTLSVYGGGMVKQDFEFTISADGVVGGMKPVYKPVAEVQIAPGADVFVDQVQVTMSDATDGVSIRYTTDGSDPTPTSALYSGPITLTDTTVVKARAFRYGVTEVPDTVSGTTASPVRRAVFTKQPAQEAVTASVYSDGLHYRYYEGDWKDLMIRMDRMTPVQEGNASGLFDFAAKATDDPYAFEYSGYLDVPTSGVYTFYAPQEWLLPNNMTGYDLQVFVGGEQWYPITRKQAFGTWSVSLEQGLHPFVVRYVDYRGDSLPAYNTPDVLPRIWPGTTPQLDLSGPGLTRQAIPTSMLAR